jgi:hypothetical protein
VVILNLMEVVSIKVDKKTKDKMRKFSNVNWSETIRSAIETKLEEEQLKNRHLDFDEIREASKMADSVRRSIKGWNSTTEIRKWRDQRK